VIELVVYVILAVYAKLRFVAFGVLCGVCFCGTVGAGFGASAEFGRVSKLQAVTAFQWAWNMWSNSNSLVSYHQGFG